MNEDQVKRIDAAAGFVAESRTALIRTDCQRRFTACWILASLVLLALHPGCAAVENNRHPTKSSSNMQKGRNWASNAQGTLYGENAGNSIILQWALNDFATEYFVYRSTSLNGPWVQVGRFSQGAASTGGARVDLTPDARLMDLCYKVEVVDAKALVIETYEPICVPSSYSETTETEF